MGDSRMGTKVIIMVKKLGFVYKFCISIQSRTPLLKYDPFQGHYGSDQTYVFQFF